MKQLTFTGFAYCKPAREWESGNSNYHDGFNFNFCHMELKGDGFISAGTATLTIDLPDGFDPRSGAVEELKAKKQKLMADFQARITQIDNQISQYLAIECGVTA